MKTDYADKLDEKLSEALSRAVLSETKTSFADRDAFQNWLEEGVQRQAHVRRRKIRRIGLAAAAVFLCIFLLSGSLLLSDTLPPSLQALLSPGEGVASPGLHSDVEAENGNVVIGGDGNGNTGTWTATFASYDDIPEKYREQIVWFEEMPEGYELETVEITETLNRIIITLKYSSTSGEMLVKQLGGVGKDTAIIESVGEKVILGDKEIYLKKGDGTISYTFLLDSKIIYLIDQANMDKEKIEAMIASVKTGSNM